MTHAPTLSPGAVARDAVAAFRGNWVRLLVTALAVFGPLTLLDVSLEGVGELSPDEYDLAGIVGVTTAFLGLAAASILGQVFYVGVVMAVVEEWRSGERRGHRQVARTLPYLRLVATDLLFVLIVVVGFLLLLIPGVVAFTWFALAAAVLELEDLGVRASFRRSRELVRGNFWRVLAILGPALLLGEALGDLLLGGGPSLLGDGFAGEWVGEFLAECLTAPIFALAAVMSTYHLIERRPAPG